MLDGRIQQLNAVRLTPGEYRLVLVTGGYFNDNHAAVFYPTIAVQFLLSGDREHYHIAVLASTLLLLHLPRQLISAIGSAGSVGLDDVRYTADTMLCQHVAPAIALSPWAEC